MTNYAILIQETELTDGRGHASGPFRVHSIQEDVATATEIARTCDISTIELVRVVEVSGVRRRIVATFYGNPGMDPGEWVPTGLPKFDLHVS